jgi:hypothetical protein
LTSGTDWFGGLPSELQSDKTLEGYKGKPVAELAKALVGAQRLIGTDKIALPKPDAPQAERDAFFNKLGRPEKADGYEIPKNLPEGVKFDPALLKTAFEFAHKHGITKAQAAEYLRFEADRTVAMQKQSEAAYEQRMAATKDELKSEFGNAFDQRMSAAKEAVVQLLGEERAKAMLESPLANDGHFIRFAAEVAKRLNVDPIEGSGGKTKFTPTPDEAKSEIAAIRANKEDMDAYMNKTSPRHKEIRARMDLLYASAFGTDSATTALKQ